MSARQRSLEHTAEWSLEQTICRIAFIEAQATTRILRHTSEKTLRHLVLDTDTYVAKI